MKFHNIHVIDYITDLGDQLNVLVLLPLWRMGVRYGGAEIHNLESSFILLW